MRAVAITILLTIALATPASAQWVYLNNSPGSCTIDVLLPWWPEALPTYVYVHAPGIADVAGATFRIESDAMGPEDVVAITPSPGVTIVSGDLFTGITLSWNPHELTHEAVLALELSANPPHQSGGEFGGMIRTQDVVLARTDGAIACESAYTHANAMIDCFGIVGGLVAPDTVDVGVGVVSTFTFRAYVAGQGGANFQFDDPLGWITDRDPQGVGGACPVCAWHVAHVTVTVSVPEDTPAHTMYPVTLRLMWMYSLREKTIVLRAVSPVATEPTSFGRLKAMYRGNDN